jgi:hypothetical protein
MRYLVLMSAVLAVACSDESPTGHSALPVGDALRGQMAFVASCSECHASNDGIDLAVFRFTDTTIIRRAVAHVDTATARDIVAHIRKLNATPLDENTRIFQPGDYTVGSDIEFAVRLFGSDSWPADMTTAKLRAIDPRTVRVAVQMPLWSDEQSNLDWMPDVPLPDAILDDQGALVRASIAGYRAAPSRENLVRAVAALRSADRRVTSTAAPCLLEDSTRVDFMGCFQLRRWTSSLVAQHMIRYGISSAIDPMLHDIWWDVGNAARKSIRQGQSVIPNARLNWAEWMYLSWSFDPSRHPSVYTGGGMIGIGMPRHATFIALRSEVARPMRSVTPYMDVQSAVGFAPAMWAYQVATFGYNHLLERLSSGERPNELSLQSARDAVNQAFTTAQRKVTATQLATLRGLRDQVLAQLQ